MQVKNSKRAKGAYGKWVLRSVGYNIHSTEAGYKNAYKVTNLPITVQAQHVYAAGATCLYA